MTQFMVTKMTLLIERRNKIRDSEEDRANSRSGVHFSLFLVWSAISPAGIFWPSFHGFFFPALHFRLEVLSSWAIENVRIYTQVGRGQRP